MQRKYFGTDGIRGETNSFPITPDKIQKLALAAADYFRKGNHLHRVVIAKDTRLSGYMIEPALTSGFIAAGYDVLIVGPMPTPALAMLTRSMRSDLGVMISASHNPYQDNGIKLFGPDGFKLSDSCELALEKKMQSDNLPLASPQEIGRARRLEDAPGRYIEFVKGCFSRSMQIGELKIVVDCAHGAAYRVAPEIIWEFGAEVIPIGVSPNGRNINEGCGSMHPSFLQKHVLQEKADLGIAFDGDADRVVISDEKGELVDGDQVIALIARDWHQRKKLQGKAVIATVMSNLGLENFVQGLGVNLLRTNVGDRNIVEKMRMEGCNLGGEPSGHIVMSDYVTTGDGLLAALQLISIMVSSGKPLSEVGHAFIPIPQHLRNIRIKRDSSPLDNVRVQSIIDANEKRLLGNGRLVVRKSGTEPILRIMAEGEDTGLINDVVNEIEQAIISVA